jgi:hypothetical protein
MIHFVNIHFVPIVNPKDGAVNAREGYFTRKVAGEMMAAWGRVHGMEMDGMRRISWLFRGFLPPGCQKSRPEKSAARAGRRTPKPLKGCFRILPFVLST